MKPIHAILGLAAITALVVVNTYRNTDPEPGSTTFDPIMGLIVVIAAIGGVSALAGYLAHRYLGWSATISASVVYVILLFLSSTVRY